MAVVVAAEAAVVEVVERPTEGEGAGVEGRVGVALLPQWPRWWRLLLLRLPPMFALKTESGGLID